MSDTRYTRFLMVDAHEREVFGSRDDHKQAPFPIASVHRCFFKLQFWGIPWYTSFEVETHTSSYILFFNSKCIPMRVASILHDISHCHMGCTYYFKVFATRWAKIPAVAFVVGCWILFSSAFFDVFCPFYNVSLVNGSSILQTKETKQPKSSKSQETRNRKSHISQEGTNYKRPRTQKPRRQSCKSQKKKTRASNPRLQSNENAL